MEESEATINDLYQKISDMKKEFDRLKLTAKLNSNSIDRLMKKIPDSIDIDID